MIQLNPDKMTRVELTPKEQKTILKHCQSLDRNTYQRIADAKNGILHFLIDDLNHLIGCIQLEIDRARKPKVQTILCKIYNKLILNPTTRKIADELDGQEFESIEDLNLRLQDVMKERNSDPDPEMGNLSPEQVSRLIYFPWEKETFPIKFNKELTHSELKDSIFLTNAITFLKTLIELKNENTATVKGNLNRKIVKIVFDKLIIDEDDREFTLKYNKVINEIDIFPLHIIRTVCESAGLIFQTKNRFLFLEDKQHLLSVYVVSKNETNLPLN